MALPPIKIRNLITELGRVLYQDPQYQPHVGVDNIDDVVTIDVDATPYDLGILIGGRGVLKFATELIIAHMLGKHHEQVSLRYESGGKVNPPPYVDPRGPDPDVIQGLIEALASMINADHRILTSGKTKEDVLTAVFHTKSKTPPTVKSSIGRIIRVAGKANGFAAANYITSRD